LLVEDSPGDARLVDRYLSKAEHATFEVERFDRLRKGLDRLRQGGFDVLLLDLTLPDSKGIETFDKAFAEAPDVPIVVRYARRSSVSTLKRDSERARSVTRWRSMAPTTASGIGI
jgi:DNA-binding response OmpR family regulator